MTDAELEARRRDHEAEAAGLIDPGQPTETAHRDHVRAMEAELSPLERRLIRRELFGAAGDDP
ncbi:MAG TPA: hypothetical protein DD491_11265 [Halieaceae bacterium]|nr:hypothetical protein [Halieaceae bacterium]|tara:strand:- start:885 stop:1073 length:189 start_codon:yes stop_codon:yes gene_type:complete